MLLLSLAPRSSFHASLRRRSARVGRPLDGNARSAFAQDFYFRSALLNPRLQNENPTSPLDSILQSTGFSIQNSSRDLRRLPVLQFECNAKIGSPFDAHCASSRLNRSEE